MDDLLPEFLAETNESLANLDVELVKLEKNPGDTEVLGNIFRLVHTIKGTCGFLGLPRLERIAHAGEDVLGTFRDGTLPVTPAAVSLILACLDRIRTLVQVLEATGSEPAGDDDAVITQLKAFIAGAPASTAIATASVDEVPATDINAAATVAAEPAPAETVCAGTDATDTLPAANPAPTPPAKAAAQSIRVSVDILESLMTLVSELVLTRNQLLQMFRGKDELNLAEPVQRLSLITSELQEGVMKTRMQPIDNAWAKLPRIVRDLSIETGKKINLRMQGGDTELDRQVLEMIKDPLTHMVRNSADHGIESAEERRRLGKPEAGTITLKAFHEGGHIIIEIADDGRGLSLERIRRKAVEKQLVSEAELERLSEQQIQQFVFRPGFSTASQVTNVSGRGVGMDVVRTNIERIGGTIELKSVEGQGATFTIKIPLTLAIVSALIVGSAGQRFAIPQISVRELVHVSPKGNNALELVNETPVLRLRNQLLPLVPLHNLLQLGEPIDLAGGTFFVVVAQVGAHQFGIVVDQVLDTEEIVIKPVSRILRGIPFYSGTTILGDGSVIMILDPNGIANAAGQSAAAATDAAASPVDEAAHGKTALIVFKAADAARKAVPMNLIARLEDIDMASLEQVSGRHVVQYRGRLMPLVAFDDDFAWPRQGRRPVLVFSERDRSVGLVVESIADIVEDEVRFDLDSTRDGVLGSAIIGGKATDLVDIAPYLTRAYADWFGEAASARPPVDLGSARVLLVDDSRFFLSLMQPHLAATGLSVTAAESAEHALKILDSGQPIDVVVTDLEMPGMDGFAFVRALRADPRWADLPVIALSSLQADNIEQRIREARFTDFVPKARRDSVLNVIARVMQQYGQAA